MKHIFTLSFFALSFLFTTAQTAEIVVFSEFGEKFTLYLNGEIKNDDPKANVTIKGLTGEFYQARIDFEDASLADFANNNVMVKQGIQVTYIIKKNKKGEYVLRFNGEAPSSGNATATDNSGLSDAKKISVVDKETTVKETPAVKTVNEPVIVKDPVQTTVTTTTTTKSNPTPSTTTEKVGINMNVGGVNMGINMNVEGEGMDMDMNVEETETTTVTTQTKTSGTQNTVTTTKPQVTPVKPVTTTPDVVTVAGCSSPMTKTAFESAKTSIGGKGFDEDRLNVAKKAVKSNCMSSSQIKEVMDLFAFDDTRLTFAKYAYDYCTDTDNYSVVSEAFSFSSSTDELNTYIEAKNK
jgi:Domain of unknown function (DUF4476)